MDENRTDEAETISKALVISCPAAGAARRQGRWLVPKRRPALRSSTDLRRFLVDPSTALSPVPSFSPRPLSWSSGLNKYFHLGHGRQCPLSVSPLHRRLPVRSRQHDQPTRNHKDRRHIASYVSRLFLDFRSVKLMEWLVYQPGPETNHPHRPAPFMVMVPHPAPLQE